MVNAANMKYLVDSGRSSRGKDHPKTKLTEQQVLWIRENCRPRHHELGFDAVAKKFGVTQSTVRRAFSGVNWKHFKDECSNCQAAWTLAVELERARCARLIANAGSSEDDRHRAIGEILVPSEEVKT